MAEEENKLFPKSKLAEEIALADYASSLPLPVDFGTHEPYKLIGAQQIPARLFGTSGEERVQLWPERMVRSAVSAPYEALSGAFGPPGSRETTERMLEPAMDIAGLAVTGPLAMKPGTASLGSGMTRMAKTGEAAVEHAPAFYSAVENAVKASKQGSATSEQWLATLKNQPGVKPEELQWTLSNLPSGKITKADLEKHIAENKIELKEVNKSDFKPDELKFGQYSKDLDIRAKDKFGKLYDELPDSQQQQIRLEAFANQNIHPSKYSKYQLPGGENYRELLLTLPRRNQETVNRLNEIGTRLNEIANLPAKETNPNTPKGQEYLKEHDKLRAEQRELSIKDNEAITSQYKSSHWDEPNVLAHVRMNDREIPNVGKTLHIEEIQSDWHQAGRKQGYKFDVDKKLETLTKEYDELNDVTAKGDITAQRKAHARQADIVTEMNKLHDLNREGVPDAPFKKTWDELALKRVIREAAEKGYDAVSWTPGEAQAARYDLSKELNSIGYQKRGNVYNVTAWDKKDKSVWNNQSATPEMIERHLGKEMADKITKGVGRKDGQHTYLEDLDLKVGGEGMKAFYDKMLVDKANAVAKKFGGKVEQVDLKVGKGRPTQYADFDAYQKAPNEEKHSVHVLKITPEMKKNALEKGFPLFSAGVPTLSPVDHDPFRKDQQMKSLIEQRRQDQDRPVAPGGKPPSTETRDVRLVPVDFNPFTNPNAI